MTAVDGYPMRKKGQAGRALVASMVSSGVGGIIGVIIAWIGATTLVPIVFKFGPPEYFAWAAMGLALVATIGSSNVLKSLISVALGLFIGTIGMDQITGISRFTFGSVSMSPGVSFDPAIIGLYALGETFNQFTRLNERRERIDARAAAATSILLDPI
jgi:putative tricarboxylic transport membrane protein